MTARPTLTAHLIESITVLSVWTGTDSERIRRFTSEALCPRGVWAKHIAALKHDPELGLQWAAAEISDNGLMVFSTLRPLTDDYYNALHWVDGN